MESPTSYEVLIYDPHGRIRHPWEENYEPDYKKYLRGLFSIFGEINYINLTDNKSREAIIAFRNRENALEAVRSKKPDGMIIRKFWREPQYDLTIDYLEIDCIFNIYSYLSLDDLLNLLEVNELQKTLLSAYHRKTEYDDFLKCISRINCKANAILNILNKILLHHTPEFNIFYNLKIWYYDINIRTFSAGLFQFAYLTIDDLYFIEDTCHNISFVELLDDTYKLQRLEIPISEILIDLKTLRLCDPEEFFTEANFRKDMELMLTDLGKQLQNMQNLGKIVSLQKLNATVKCLEKIRNLTNSITSHYTHEKLQETDPALVPYFTNNLRFLSESRLVKFFKILEIDFEFYNITEDDMEFFSKFENLKYLIISCRPLILVSVEFLATIEQLLSYNNLKKMRISIKWLDRSDDSGIFVENFKIKIEQMLKPLSLKIRVLHPDRKYYFSFDLNGMQTSDLTSSKMNV